MLVALQQISSCAGCSVPIYVMASAAASAVLGACSGSRTVPSDIELVIQPRRHEAGTAVIFSQVDVCSLCFDMLRRADDAHMTHYAMDAVRSPRKRQRTRLTRTSAVLYTIAACLTITTCAYMLYMLRQTRDFSATGYHDDFFHIDWTEHEAAELAAYHAVSKHRLLLASHNRLFWYNTETENVTVLHEGQVGFIKQPETWLCTGSCQQLLLKATTMHPSPVLAWRCNMTRSLSAGRALWHLPWQGGQHQWGPAQRVERGEATQLAAHQQCRVPTGAGC